MELRRACDSIIRSSSSPLLYFLAPSLPRRPYVPLLLSPSAAKGCHRTFSNGFHKRQDSAEAAQESTDDTPSPRDSSTDALIDSLIGQRPATSSQRTSRFSSPRAQEANRPGASFATSNEHHSQTPVVDGPLNNAEIKSLIDDLPKRAESQRPRSSLFQNLPRGDSSSSDLLKAYTSFRSRSGPGIDIDRMQSPISSTSASPSRDLISTRPPMHPPEPTLRFDSSTGRSVTVDSSRGMDLGRGFKMLEIRCAVNNVKRDHYAQRFHERAGLKRKRLRRLRWRKGFKLGFKAAVQKVADMRRKGW